MSDRWDLDQPPHIQLLISTYKTRTSGDLEDIANVLCINPEPWELTLNRIRLDGFLIKNRESFKVMVKIKICLPFPV